MPSRFIEFNVILYFPVFWFIFPCVFTVLLIRSDIFHSFICIDILLMQHAYRDGRLEEVVLRHLGAEDGHVMIAKNIRFYLVSSFLFNLFSNSQLKSLFDVHSFIITNGEYSQAFRLPWWLADKVNSTVNNSS